jgi:hypothetical protein
MTHLDRPRVRVALPWAQDALDELREAGSVPALPALRWLAGRGNPVRVARPWREWLLTTTGTPESDALEHWPAGAALAAAAGAGPGLAPGWGVAQPVHLAAGMDHLRLAPLADAVPQPDEVEAIAATVRQHFAGEAFELTDYVDGAWVLRCEDPVVATTQVPADLVGRNIADAMPQGPDGARLRSLMNEIQMLLHGHPVNERRERRRQLPINALWLWGFGALPAVPATSIGPHGWQLRTDDLWLHAYWRAHAGDEAAPGYGRAEGRDVLIALSQPPTGDAGEALAEVDSSLLARLVDAVQSGELQLLEVHLGRSACALDRRSRYRFWRRPADVQALA